MTWLGGSGSGAVIAVLRLSMASSTSTVKAPGCFLVIQLYSITEEEADLCWHCSIVYARVLTTTSDAVSPACSVDDGVGATAPLVHPGTDSGRTQHSAQSPYCPEAWWFKVVHSAATPRRAVDRGSCEDLTPKLM